MVRNVGHAASSMGRLSISAYFSFVLKGRILEIAPGHGRWTQFLQDHCTSLIGVDLATTCVSECRSKFKSDPRLHFEVGDGRKLPMVTDASIDFAFSFDSLVHAEADILESYASELARVLKPNAIAFLHHSKPRDFDRTFNLGKAETSLVRCSN